VEAIAITAAAAGVLAISKRVEVMAEWVTLQPYILPQVEVLIKEEVSVKKRSIIIQAKIV
jgi:hypothetical protein